MTRHKKDSEAAEFKFGRIIRRLVGRRAWMLVVVVMVSCSVGFAVRAYGRRAQATISATIPSFSGVRASVTQTAMQARERLEARLTLQPEADRMRRRLGERFQSPGREVSAMTGVLTTGSDRKVVRIIRIQDEEGERVDIALGTAQTSFSWTSREGVTSSGKPAADADRSLIERLVFDSPDQFVQAQLRLASYSTIVRGAMPAEAKGSDDYRGPVWNLVRVTEPEKSVEKQPLSSVRLYYVNASTGLIDKVAYEESGQTVLAELSGWSKRGGEMVATHITWSRDKQVLMDFVADGVSHGPKQ